MNKKFLIIGLLFLILFFAFTVMLKTVDVSAIGPENSEVGLSTINGAISEKIGSNMTWYKISWWAGNVAIGIMCAYALIGLIQVIKRKSLLKVDKQIMILGGFYIVTLVIYILFEKIIINYRPVLIDGELEASYPSSHTVLAIFTCLSSIIINNVLFKNKYTKVINVLVCLLMIFIVVGRIISGVHWATDIFGGILISLALVNLFRGLIGGKN